MESILITLVKVFGVIFTGLLAARLRVLGPAAEESITRYVYYFALPPMMFNLTARASWDEFFHWGFLGAFLGGAFINLALALAAGHAIFHRRGADLTLIGMGAVFGNTAYMGIPVFLTTFGPDHALPAVIATIASNVVLLGGCVAAIDTHTRSGDGSAAKRLAKILVTNPLLIGSFLGLAFAGTTWQMPAAVDGLLDAMAMPAASAALFAIGMSLHGGAPREGRAEVFSIVAMKMAVQPVAAGLLAAYVFHLEAEWLRATILMSAMPVGALVYVVSRQYGVRAERASAAVVVSTTLAIAVLGGLLVWFETWESLAR